MTFRGIVFENYARIRHIVSMLGKHSKKSEKGTIPKTFMRKFLPQNPIIVEAGAHAGWDTLEMSELWPSGMIHAFEPVPRIFEMLRCNTHNRRNVICYPLALADKTGEAKIYVSAGASDCSSSLFRPKEHLVDHPDVWFQDEIVVPTITLDDWAGSYRIGKVDFLWLDMQGYELASLQAALTILESVSGIYVEVSLKETYEKVPLYQEIRQWLYEHGFRVVREELPWEDMGNVFFVRST